MKGLPPLLTRSAIQRAFQEFLLIVLGVLVALWVNDLNQRRQDRQRERVDLQQLLTTTRDNERRILEAIQADSGALADSRRLLGALSSPASLPPGDSLATWRDGAFRFSVFFPMVGTYTALAQTGDLNLIRNDSLRAQVAAYAGVLEGTAAQIADWTQTFHRNVAELVRAVPIARIRDIARGTTAPDRAWRIDVLERALYLQTIISANRVSDLEHLLEATRSLRASLEDELAHSR